LEVPIRQTGPAMSCANLSEHVPTKPMAKIP
jgi:hypothetical protein